MTRPFTGRSLRSEPAAPHPPFDEGTFTRADVTSPRHPEHAALLDILRDPLLQQPGIDIEMLMPLLPEVVASDLRLPLLYDASRRAVEQYLGR